jgi:hypothetical protein
MTSQEFLVHSLLIRNLTQKTSSLQTPPTAIESA